MIFAQPLPGSRMGERSLNAAIHQPQHRRFCDNEKRLAALLDDMRVAYEEKKRRGRRNVINTSKAREHKGSI